MSGIKALDHALDRRSPVSHFLNPERFNQRLESSLSRSTETAIRRQQSILGGMPTNIETDYSQLITDLSSTGRSYIRSTQKTLAMNDLKTKFPQHFERGLGEILNDLHAQDSDFFLNPGVERIENMLKRYSPENKVKNNNAFSIELPDETARKEFVEGMFTTLQKRADARRLDRRVLRGAKRPGSIDGVPVQGSVNLKNKLIDDFVSRHQKKETFLTKMMGGAGYRPVVNKDLLEKNESGKWVNKLFDNDSVIRRRINGEAVNGRIGNKIAAMANKDSRFLDLVADHRIFINDAGHIVDTRSLHEGLYKSASFVQQNFQVPFLRFNPLDLAHWTTYEAMKEAPKTYLMQRGTIQPSLHGVAETLRHPRAHNQDAAVGVLSRDYLYSNNKVMDLVSGEIVKDNVTLASARFGAIPRAMSSIANLHTGAGANRGFIKRLFDIGGQESETILSRALSTFTKFDDPNWMRNRYKTIFKDDATIKDLESSYKDIYAEINSRAKPLSDDTANFLNSYAKQAYGESNIDLGNLFGPDDIMGSLGRIRAGMSEKNGRIAMRKVGSQVSETWEKYHNNQGEFLKGKRIVSDNAPYLMGPLQPLDVHETNIVNRIDDVKRLIHQHAIEQIEQTAQVSVADLVREGIKNGNLPEKAAREVGDLSVLNELHRYWDDVYRLGPQAKTEALEAFKGDLIRRDDFREVLSNTVTNYTPIWSMGPGDQPPQPFGLVGNLVMNKGRGKNWMLEDINRQITDGVSPLKASTSSAMKVLGQPFAGRKNIQDFTMASMIPYYFAERLDNSLAKIGLGLSQKNRGSMQSIITNQFGRRIVLPYVALQQLQHLDGMTGDRVSDKAADTYANMSLDTAWFKQFTGINQIGKEFAELIPGLDQLWKTPIGAAVKYGSFGFFGDTRSEDELRHYYESGEDAVRKGRWWGIGSTTPWEGGKIDRFQPNWYRRMKSDYKFTDTMYGSESEYWANSWMPTLTHPFAPIKHFLTDPDHYEKKHAEDRPYPISGGIQELGMIPLIGPALNRTVGGLLNPYRENKDLSKAHREYQKEVNDYITSQYDSATGEGVIQFMPAGGYNLLSESSSFGGGFGEGLSSLDAPSLPQLTRYGKSGPSSSGAYTTGALAMDNLGSINAGIVAAGAGGTGAGAGVGPGGGMLLPARPMSSLESLRDPDFVADLKDIGSPYSGSQVLGDMWYGLTEQAGIYGFSANMAMGIDTNIRSQKLDRSSRMMSYGRSFWDMEMGGADGFFGGEFSEIARRYLAKDPRKQYYNPLQNKMPDWLPGVNYFIDFQHGDPYTKVAKGEMRLPGAAYESLNKLHPDTFGDYGAFDRFKILADVAPYSDEYKYWRRMVSQMKEAGALTTGMEDEYAEVRDQVAAKKDKYHFYPNKFRNAEVDNQKVTVTKVLDANTFLTAEHPNNPIRLAGVKVKADAEKAKEWLQQYIYEGAKITIGVDADPINRVRDDTMNTMHAVVYSNGNDHNPFYMSTKGQSVNAMLARKFDKKDGVNASGENTGVGTIAMYDKTQVTVGRMMEWMTHDAIPKIPIVGVIADKFMQVRSPLEMYKKNEVYGKAWRPWTDPWGGWIQPMLETAASQNPLVGAAQGYGIGWLFGKKGAGKYYGKWVGAAVFGGLAAARSIDEFVGRRSPGGDDYAWIPKRREKERAINEYFDVLKYMKYKGLYERAAERAKDEEGIDVDQLVGDSGDRGQKNKKLRNYLDASKKWLSMAKKIGYVDEDVVEEQLDNVRSRLKMIDQDRGSYRIGSKTMQALQYKEQYESTLYGADPNGDMTKIFRALPSKDREFFTQFMTAAPKEREEILRLVPKNQRRFYQAKWGMDTDEPESLNSYFKDHYLPNAKWEGWDANVNLDDIKLKVVRNEGLELTEFGMWQDDVKNADSSGVNRIEPFRPSMSIDITRIEKILQGAGLKDAQVSMTTSPLQGENKISLAMDFIKDRRDEIVSEFNNNMGSIFG
jgi:hypothetical protein